MPITHPTASNNILEYTVVAANALRDVAAVAQMPFVSRVCTLTLAIISMVQNTKFQKDRCLRIVEDVHHLLCVLTNFLIYSEDIQSPRMLNQITQYAVTLQKIDSCLRAQGELGTLKRLFKQSELIGQLAACETELKAVLDSFMMEQGVGLASALVELNTNTERRHQDLLELLSTQSSSVDTMSSGKSSFNSSSGSLLLLPGTPKVFHGRQSELEDVVNALLAEPARVAILGPGGMGKTTLAVAALHSPEVARKYITRHFIPNDSAQTNDSLVVEIASHLGLETSRRSARHVIHHLTVGPPCLLVLDNFETPWEPLDGRAKAEDFLSLLSGIPHVALLITMRGTERPSKVQWTRPFLRPLNPLDTMAARQTFIEIADEIHSDSEVEQLLDITDNIPLAVQLIASISASEGCQATLLRWKREKTALLSVGYDKRSNLEMSIMLSLSSPRMLSLPHAADLLSLMSLLSDGLSDKDLIQSKLPIPELLKCKTTLVRTSLAYVDHAGRLKVLSPIRDYIHTTRPPSPHLVWPLQMYFTDLLKLWTTWLGGFPLPVDLIPQLFTNLGNLHHILLYRLDHDANLEETIQGIIWLSRLNLVMNRGFTPLMLRLPEKLNQINDHGLHGQYITEVFQAHLYHAIPDPDKSMNDAIEHFHIIKDIAGEARLFSKVATYYFYCARDHTKARHFNHRAHSLALQCNSHVVQAEGLTGLAIIEIREGNWSEALRLAYETRRIAAAAGNVMDELVGIVCQARCYMGTGDFKHAMQLVKEGKALIVRLGIQGGDSESTLINFEAELYRYKTEYTEARHIQDVILHQTSPLLVPVDYGFTLVNIVYLDLAMGTSAESVFVNLQAAAAAFRSARYPRGIEICELHTADLKLREGDKTGACTQYVRAFTGAYGTDDELTCHCLATLADSENPVHAASEVARWAIVFLAYTMHKSSRSMLVVHQALRCFGDVLAQESIDDEALNILTVALEGFTWMDVHQSRADCMKTMGDVHLRRGETLKACTLWKEARPLFERSSQAKAVSKIDSRLAKLTQQHEKSLEQLSKLPAIPPQQSLAALKE